MHIVLVTHYALPHQGGIEFVTGQLASRLADRGCTVTLVTSNIGIAEDGPRPPGGVRLMPVPALNTLEGHGIPYPVFHPIKLAQALQSALRTADIVHLHGLLYQSCVVAAWMAHRRGIPVVLTEHTGFVRYRSRIVHAVERLAFATVGRLCCRLSDSIVVLNRRIEAELKPLARAATPFRMIYNGVDTSLFRPAAPPDRARLRSRWGFTRPTVLFVGRLVEKKGIHLLAEAVSEAFQLVVCGRGVLPLTHPNIRLLGQLDPPTLVELYQAADLFALPATDEGFPLVVQEALACGLPVIVSDDAINRDYLDETVAVFAERSAAAFRAAIHSLLADARRRQAMGSAGRQYALDRFNWERTASAYLDIYRQLAGRASTGGG